MSKNNKLRWHYVAADYEYVHVDENHRRQLWERRVFVFRSTVDKAESLALKIAKERAHEYKNGEGKRIKVKFRGIESTSELFDSKLITGTEVYWDWSVKPNPDWRKPKPKKKTKRSPIAKRK